MKLLVDNCLSYTVAVALEAAGHDVESVGEWAADPGDRLVLAAAARAGRVLLTADREFGELVVFERLPNAGIIILQKIAAEDHADACLRAIVKHEPELMAGGVVIVLPEKMRARTPKPDA